MKVEIKEGMKFIRRLNYVHKRRIISKIAKKVSWKS